MTYIGHWSDGTRHDCTNVQADLSLFCAHAAKSEFVATWTMRSDDDFFFDNRSAVTDPELLNSLDQDQTPHFVKP